MALLPNTGLETHPTGTVNVTGIINGDWECIERIFDPDLAGASPQFGVIWRALGGQAGLTTITYAASVDLALAASYPVNKLALTGNVTIAVTEKTAGRNRVVILTADGTTRNVTWPAGAVWATDPLTSVAAGTTAVVTVIAQSTTDASLVLSAFLPSGAAGTNPEWASEMTCLATVADNDPALAGGTWSGFSPAPVGRVDVWVNQARIATVGDGVKTKDCYFSLDAGTTALSHAAIATATSLHWVGTVAGFQLAITDKIALRYNS